MLRGAYGGDMAGKGLHPWPVVPQQGRGAGGERDDASELAGSGGVVETSAQVGALGSGPRQGRLAVGQDGNWGRRGADRLGGSGASLAGEEDFGDRGGVLVVVKQ